MVVFAKILDFVTLVASAPLAFAVAMYITIITTHRNPKKWNDLGWGPLLLYIIYTILNMVFHWWKHRKKYKELTKVKALLGILFTGVINLLVLWIGGLAFIGAGGDLDSPRGPRGLLLVDLRRAMWGGWSAAGPAYSLLGPQLFILLVIFGVSLAGVIPDLLARVFWLPP